MLRKVRQLDPREQRRRQERQLMAKGTASVTQTGTLFAVPLTPGALSSVKGRVASHFGLTESGEKNLNSRVEAINNHRDAFIKSLGDLFSFSSEQHYLAVAASAAEHSAELSRGLRDYLADPVIARMEGVAIPSGKSFVDEFGKQYARQLGHDPKNLKAESIEGLANSYYEQLQNAKAKLENNRITFSNYLRDARAFEIIGSSVERVATEGSPLAAYLYFTRVARLVLPENSENKADIIARQPSIFPMFLFQKLRLLWRPKYMEDLYISAAREKLDALVLALDQEERRVRFSSRGRHIAAHIVYFRYEPKHILDFGQILQKVAIRPWSATEILTEVPIGQRRSAFEMLRQNPDIVGIYDRLKDYGLDARTYASFALDFARVTVDVNGKRQTIRTFIANLAAHEEGKLAAVWLVNHPEVWASSDVPAILKNLPVSQAKPDASPSAVQPTKDVAEAAKSEPLYRQPEQHRSGKASAPKGLVLWANVAYHGNVDLAAAAISAFEAVPQEFRYRIKQVDAQVRKGKAWEGSLASCYRSISGLSRSNPALIKYVFSDDWFFDSFVKRLSGLAGKEDESAFIDRLEKVVAESSNPYVALQKILTRQVVPFPAQLMVSVLAGRKETGDSASYPPVEGYVCRIAIFGNYENNAKSASVIAARLMEEGIEAVFVSQKDRGTPPVCEGMLVAPGRDAPHSANVRHAYEGRLPVMKVSGYGVESVVRDAVALRDRIRMSEQVSA